MIAAIYLAPNLMCQPFFILSNGVAWVSFLEVKALEYLFLINTHCL